MANEAKRKSRNQSALLAFVAEIAEVCVGTESVDDAYQALLQKIKGTVAFDAATIYAAGGSDGKLRHAASVGGTVEILEFLRMEQGDGMAGWTAESKKPIVLSDRSGHRDFDPDKDYASFMSVPLVRKNQVVAVVNFGAREPGTYSAADAETASLISGQMLLALEKLELERRNEDMKLQLDSLQKRIHFWEKRVASLEKPEATRETVAKINHDVNNALAILVGNVQCMLMEKTVVDQKTLSRLKRMERALLKINKANHKILELVYPGRKTADTGPVDIESDTKAVTEDA